MAMHRTGPSRDGTAGQRGDSRCPVEAPAGGGRGPPPGASVAG